MNRDDFSVLATCVLALVWLWELWKRGRRQGNPVIRSRQL